MLRTITMVSGAISTKSGCVLINNSLVITKPMDFSTMSKNVKAQRYKSKADFAADLDLIWNNCLYFNTQEVGPPSHVLEHRAS